MPESPFENNNIIALQYNYIYFIKDVKLDIYNNRPLLKLSNIVKNYATDVIHIYTC